MSLIETILLYFSIHILYSPHGLILFGFLPLIVSIVILIRAFWKDNLITPTVAFIISNLIFLLNTQFLPVIPFYHRPESVFFSDDFYIVNYRYFTIDFLNITYSLGVDVISFFLLLLTSLTIFLSVIASYDSIHLYQRYYYSLIFLIQFLLFQVFLSTNLFFFYVFFESILIPMFILIGIWGSRSRKIHAAYQFFFYTLVSSLFLLAALTYIGSTVGSYDYVLLFTYKFTFFEQCCLWLPFFFALAVKMPLFPFHIWLPEAHAEASTGGSMILAGILLKVGGYGIIRFLLTFLSEASYQLTPIVFAICILGTIFPALAAIRQTDLKRFVAYSSVVHMNFMTMGLFSFTKIGLTGAMITMFNHGIISCGLFAAVGVIYDRFGTRNMQELGTLASKMPLLYFFFVIMFLANIGFPGTNGFVGEFLLLIGIFNISPLALLLAGVGLYLNTVYNVLVLVKIFFGTRRNENIVREYSDLTSFEFYVCFGVTLLIFLFGIFPQPMINFFDQYDVFLDFIIFKNR